MLRKRVVVWAAVRLRVQEALALLWTLLQSASLSLPLCSCGPKNTCQIRFLEFRAKKISELEICPTHDVVHAEGTGSVLQQPGVDAVFVELMSTRDDPQMLA